MSTRGMVGRLQEFPIHRGVGLIVWVIGASTTWLFLESVNPNWGLNWLAALLGQAVLTSMQSPAWSGRFDVLGVTALVTDALLNAGGVFVFVQRLDETATWYALATGFGLGGELSNIVAVLLSLAVGVFLAGAPEYIWRRGNDG